MAKKAQAAKPDEQTTVLLLREILAELRRLNANLERRSAGPPPSPQGMEESDLDEDSEELEYFE